MPSNNQDRPCPICLLPLDRFVVDGSLFLCDCRRCGKFRISRDASDDLPGTTRGHPKARALISHLCRRSFDASESPVSINQAYIDQAIQQTRLPTPPEQLDNLVRVLGNSSLDIGSRISINPEDYQAKIGADDPQTVSFICSEATRLGLTESPYEDYRKSEGWKSKIDGTNYLGGLYSLRLTMEGWNRYDQLRRTGGVGRTAFMALKFGDVELDGLVNDFIRPAIADTGFELRRLDDEPRAGLIDDQMRVQIRACRFLLAELTHGNSGAYWEAGFAEGLGKPVIYLCRKSVFDDAACRPHFDTNHHLTITWDLATAEKDMERLKATVRFSIPEARQVDSQK